MVADYARPARVPEGESFERKSSLDPTKAEDILGLVADIVAMANTAGGAIQIGETGKAIPRNHVPLFDSARLDDKVNSFVEPPVCGIRSALSGDDFVVVEVDKSQNPPHVFKKDGNYHDERNKQQLLFRLGDILSRHSSKTARASRSDFDRWFQDYRKHLFENVRMIFEAGPTARVQIAASEGVPVRIAPDAPGAQAVYDLLTPDPFRDLEQELIGGIKAWKTSGQFLNQAQILKAYARRGEISDSEVIELILRSCWESRLPGYYWAVRIHASRLFSILEEVISADRYPTSTEALKVASLLPRVWAKALLGRADSSTRRSVRNLAKKLESVMRARTRKHAALAQLVNPGNTLRYKVAEDIREVRVDAIGDQVLEELLQTLVNEIKENRAPFRLAELLTYGLTLSETQDAESQVGDHAPTDISEEPPTLARARSSPLSARLFQHPLQSSLPQKVLNLKISSEATETSSRQLPWLKPKLFGNSKTRQFLML